MSNAFLIGSQWEFPMGLQWIANGVLMKFQRIAKNMSHGFHINFHWISNGFPMDSNDVSWISKACPMYFEWISYGEPMDFKLISCVFPRDFPLMSGGFPMDFE